jgi:hypothetical protein
VDLGANVEHSEKVQSDNKLGKTDLSTIISNVENVNDKFVSNLLSEGNLNRKNIQMIVNNVKQLQRETYDIIVPYLNENLSAENSTIVTKILGSTMTTFEHSKHKTEYLRVKSLTEQKLYIKPMSYLIGNQLQPTTKLNQTTMKTMVLEGQHISIKKTFEILFTIPGVLEQAKSYMSGSKDNVYCDFKDGLLWEKLKKPFGTKTVFPIFIFFDDFECGDALGSHSGINSIGGTYITPKCFHPKFLSKLINIFPTLIFHSLDRKHFGNYNAFRPLIHELVELETSGLEINVNNKLQKIYFVLGLMLGDNKGLNSILGFTENFVNARCCRFCTADRYQIRSLTVENQDLMRTIEEYENNVALNDLTITGIKDFCIFNEIPSFHVISNYSVDIMHDVLEGVFLYDMAKIVYNLIYVHKLFSLDYLNSKIKCFNYGNLCNKNKPASITKEHLQRGYLRMSASESYLFVCTLRFYVGHLVPLDNTEWQLYVKLLEISDIIFNNCIPKEMLLSLKVLIREHNEMFIDIFGPLKPKFHFLLHYPTIIINSGPLTTFSSIRYESKHSELKCIIKNSKCRKNIPLSLAKRYQMKMSQRFLKKEGFQCNPTFSKLKLFQKDYLFVKQNICADAYEAQMYRHYGQTYIVKSIICIENGEIWPKFGTVQKILVKPFLQFFVKELNVINYNMHFAAYLISDETNGNERCIEFNTDQDLPTLYKMYKKYIY